MIYTMQILDTDLSDRYQILNKMIFVNKLEWILTKKSYLWRYTTYLTRFLQKFHFEMAL